MWKYQLFIHLLIDMWVVSSFWLLQGKLLWTLHIQRTHMCIIWTYASISHRCFEVDMLFKVKLIILQIMNHFLNVNTDIKGKWCFSTWFSYWKASKYGWNNLSIWILLSQLEILWYLNIDIVFPMKI